MIQLPYTFSNLASLKAPKKSTNPKYQPPQRKSHNSSIPACCYSLLFGDMQNVPGVITTITNTHKHTAVKAHRLSASVILYNNGHLGGLRTLAAFSLSPSRKGWMVLKAFGGSKRLHMSPGGVMWMGPISLRGELDPL